MSGKNFVDLVSMTVADGPLSYRSMPLGNMLFVAGVQDKLGLQELIDELIGKTGSQVEVSNGEIASSLKMQMLNVPYQTLCGTSEYFENIPIGSLLGHPGLECKILWQSSLIKVSRQCLRVWLRKIIFSQCIADFRKVWHKCKRDTYRQHLFSL